MNDLFDKSRPRRNLDGGRVIAIRGAREHNLKNVDVELPRDQLVVFTGLSGSGKSSLAFDTIYAEGQRRYVESLSAYARQFLEMMQKPDVDQIDGLSPAISIEQKTTSRNPRSTVGTVTEIYDYMRLLWARVGVPYSPATGLPIESQTVSQMVDRILALPEGTRLYLLAPVVRGRKGEYRKELAELLKKGFQRVKVDGKFYEIGEVPALDKKFNHDIDVVVDRIVVRPDIGTRLADSLEQALEARRRPRHRRDRRRRRGRRREGQQAAQRVRRAADLLGEIRLPGVGLHDSRDRAAPVLVQQPVRRLPEMRRARRRAAYRPGAGHPTRTARCTSGAIRPGRNRPAPITPRRSRRSASTTGSRSTPNGRTCRRSAQDAILNGSGEDEIRFAYDDGMRSYETKKPFEGVVTNLERRWQETESDWAREEIAKYFTDVPCDACKGYRLKPEALCVKVGGQHIGEVAELSIKRAGEWFAALPAAAHQAAERDRGARAQGDPRPAELPRSMSASNT